MHLFHNKRIPSSIRNKSDEQQLQEEQTTRYQVLSSKQTHPDTVLMPSNDSFPMIELDPLTPVSMERKVISKPSQLTTRASSTSSVKSNKEVPMYWSAYCNVDKKDWSRIEHIGDPSNGLIWPSQNADQMFQCIRGGKKKE